ncbi:MAG: hypothetical protein RI932_503 [Pseudomonadota bacterium]|jgi:tRNA dimethylallyltransferase
MHEFEKAVFVVGATATGKTALAHLIADRLKQHGQTCELVNIDAFQFYRGVTAGTAKPEAQERLHYSYHGIDVLEPLESMDAARYAEFVWSVCRDVAGRGHLPVCVGGSGLYLRSVLHGLDPLPPRHDELRNMFRASAAAWGWPELHRWLALLDPERAAQLHPNDKTRIERALEIYFQLPEGVTSQSLLTKSKKLSEQEQLGQTFIIRVDCADTVLKNRINTRIDEMFAHGWLDEVIALRAQLGPILLESQAFKAIGYREIWAWLDAFEASPESAQGSLSQIRQACAGALRERIATLTWQYVRRQRTWNAKERCDWAVDSTHWAPDQFSWDNAFVDFLSK